MQNIYVIKASNIIHICHAALVTCTVIDKEKTNKTMLFSIFAQIRLDNTFCYYTYSSEMVELLKATKIFLDFLFSSLKKLLFKALVKSINMVKNSC
jgi:hypothetical protein